MPTFEYRAIKVAQTENGPNTVLFAASAVDIHSWAGIPQKRTVDGADSAGFQRIFDEKRNNDLLSFFNDPKNTLQNPLMCATNGQTEGYVKFVADPSQSGDVHNQTGTLIIDDSYLDGLTLVELFGVVRGRLESRLPHLKNVQPSESKVATIKEEAFDQNEGELEFDDANEDDVQDPELESSAETTSPQDAIVDVARESMVDSFWEEIAARHEVLKELVATSAKVSQRDEFGGFSREALLAYSRPVVLVDGQHRLLGAVKAAEQAFISDHQKVTAEIKALSALSDAEAQRVILRRRARHLPVSLLLSDDPAEHVFQFVVVNQKATPVAKALLGTIISTTLSESELDRVATRLEAAKIPLDDSRAVTYMATNPRSPFYQLVNRGIRDGKGADSVNLLEWSVLLQLIDIFRRLKGARLEGIAKTDWASAWATWHLKGTGIVGGIDSAPEAFASWSAIGGPWREVFIQFFTTIRDHFGDTDNPTAHNAWCNPRTSQLFNKPSLLILSADFFRYLRGRELTLNSAEDVSKHVLEWLGKVDPKYFSVRWGDKKDGLLNVKKDAPATRKAWTAVWLDYVANPTKLPIASKYRPG